MEITYKITITKKKRMESTTSVTRMNVGYRSVPNSTKPSIVPMILKMYQIANIPESEHEQFPNGCTGFHSAFMYAWIYRRFRVPVPVPDSYTLRELHAGYVAAHELPFEMFETLDISKLSLDEIQFIDGENGGLQMVLKMDYRSPIQNAFSVQEGKETHDDPQLQSVKDLRHYFDKECLYSGPSQDNTSTLRLIRSSALQTPAIYSYYNEFDGLSPPPVVPKKRPFRLIEGSEIKRRCLLNEY